MRVLVTGSQGFVGGYMVEFLESRGEKAVGLSRGPNKKGQREYLRADVTDPRALVESLRAAGDLDGIIHLAGFSSAALSFKHPRTCKNVNVGGTRNLLDACEELDLDPRIVVVSSSRVYYPPETVPIKEDHPTRGVSPYELSRLEQEKVVLERVEEQGLDAVILRSFNHTGPGQSSEFFLPSMARQVARVEAGLQEFVELGDLDVVRDFMDVRDTVRAYRMALTGARKGEIYNVCSGKGYLLRDLYLEMASLATRQVKLKTREEKVRKEEKFQVIGDNSKLRTDTGWCPDIPMETTLKDLLVYWRGVVKRETHGGSP